MNKTSISLNIMHILRNIDFLLDILFDRLSQLVLRAMRLSFYLVLEFLMLGTFRIVCGNILIKE